MKVVLSTILLLFVSLSTTAQAHSAAANWVAVYKVGPQHVHTVEHTPKQTCFDGMCKEKGVFVGSHGKINGLEISECGLELYTDSTPSQFEAAMQCAALNPQLDAPIYYPPAQ